jgi:hypothetical protein
MVYRYTWELNNASVTIPTGRGTGLIAIYSYQRTMRPTVIEYAGPPPAHGGGDAAAYPHQERYG